MAWAEQQYHECLLRDSEAEPARRYLEARAISGESVEKFRLGYSPNRWDWLLRRAGAAGLDAKLLESVGLLVPAEGRSGYDRFRGRVLFSIRDVQGRAIGLGGRVLPESGSTSPAKYINSPETPLFRKSEHLYGLDVARDAVRRSGVAVVMEGYTDVIMAHQCGFDSAVAVLGTALGPRHVQVLKRFANQIVLVLDGDEAGQRRTNEVLDLFVSENVDLRIATLPDDLDPCEFLLERGADAFREVLQSRAVDALEHAFQVATRGIDLAHDIHRATEALEGLVGMLAKAPRLRPDSGSVDRFREERMLQRLAASFRVPERDIRERLTALRRGAARRETPNRRMDPPARGASREAAGDKPLDMWQRGLLELLIRYPECLAAARVAVRPGELVSASARVIYEAMERIDDSGDPLTFDRLMLEFDDPALKSLLVELDDAASRKKMASPGVVLEEWIRNFQSERTEQQNLTTTDGPAPRRIGEERF